MEAQGNITVPVIENTVEAGDRAPVAADRADPAIANLAGPVLAAAPVPTAQATATMANLATAAMVPVVPVPAPIPTPVVAPVVAPRAPAGQDMAILAAAMVPFAAPVVAPAADQGMGNLAGGFDIGGALGGSNPPSKHDMSFKIWEKL